MNPREWSLSQVLTGTMLVFILGVTSASVSWKTNVDRTNGAQSDSIYVNAVKYSELQEYCVQLQAVNRVQTERLDILETYGQTSEKILRDLYRLETGRAWNE